MKNIIATIMLVSGIISYSSASSQDTSVVAQQQPKEVYCYLVIEPWSWGTMVVASIDDGRNESKRRDSWHYILDENDKRREFDSAIAAINYMVSLGWEYVDDHSTDTSDTTRKTRILLMRKRT